MMWRWVAVAGLVLVVEVGHAAASERSKLLTARGLVEFHAAQYDKALDAFNAAVEADPADVYARYYRAMTRGRLNDSAGAIEDLRAALATQPDFAEAALELGVALLQSGEPAAAVPWLEQAQRTSELEARASMFLGVAQLRLGESARADDNLRRAVRRDPSLQGSVEYYRGIAEYEARHWGAAETHFAHVLRAQPQSAMGTQARAFIEHIHRGTRPAVLLYGAAGFQYDSNVVLAPSNEAASRVSVSHQADGRAVLNAGANFVPLHSDHVELSAGYDFYQTLHFKLHDFNLQDHRPSLQLLYDAGMIQFGVLGRFDYYVLKESSFLDEESGLPWLRIANGDAGRTELYFRARRRDFIDPTFRNFDSLNYAPGLRQYFYLDSADRYLFVSYQFDREQPTHDDVNSQRFGYDGQEVGTGAGWLWPALLSAQVSYTYRHERYYQDSVVDGVIRRDDEHRFIAAIDKPLTDWLTLDLAYLGTLNDSNQALFEYNRHIGSVTLGVRF